VETSPGFDAPARFPSNGWLKRHPLRSAGSLGMVPPLPRSSGRLRLPAARLAALGCLRLAIPSSCPLFVPTSPGPGLGIILELVSRVSGRPLRRRWPGLSGSRATLVSLRPVLGPRSDRRTPSPCGAAAWPPLVSTTVAPTIEDFGARSHGIGTRCLRFAVEVARHHARLASGCWLGSAGRDSFTRRVAMKGFRVRVSSSFLELA
jgi:hypothetical protein